MKNPLASPDEYSLFIHRLPLDYPVIRHSTLTYIPMGIKIGRLNGMILFPNDIILCVQEFLNFELQVIEGYGYEISDSGSNRLTMSSLPGFGLFFSIFFYNNINPCGFFPSRCQTRINGFDPLSNFPFPYFR